MAWTTPPSFAVGQSLTAATLTAMAADLSALKASPQIQSITTAPFVGAAPATNQPNFLWDVNSSTEITDGSGVATYSFGAAFPNGVLVCLAVAGESAIAGLVVNLQKSTVTLSSFTVHCFHQNTSSTYTTFVNAAVLVQWIAVGF